MRYILITKCESSRTRCAEIETHKSYKVTDAKNEGIKEWKNEPKLHVDTHAMK